MRRLPPWSGPALRRCCCWRWAGAAACCCGRRSWRRPALRCAEQAVHRRVRPYSPVSATQLGDHRFDGDLDDLGAAGRARTLAWVKGVLGELQGIDHAQLSRANQVDAAMLENQLRYAVWSRGKISRLVVGSARLHAARRSGAVRPPCARVRAAAAAPELGDRAAGKAARAARADARQPGACARPGDPCRNRSQAEPGRAEPGRRTGRAEPRAAARARASAPRAGHCRCPRRREVTPAMARADPRAAGQGRISASAANCTTRSSASR